MKKWIAMLLLIVLILCPYTVFSERDPDIFDQTLVDVLIERTPIMDLQAKSAILIDAATGTVLFEKNADRRLPMASITKIMTTYLIMEQIEQGVLDYSDMVPVSRHAYSMGGSQVYLEIGERFTVKEMLQAIEIHSANDACVAMAEKIAGTEQAFVDLMNEQIKEWGFLNTHFVDSTGLTSEGQYSTAREIALISARLIETYPQIFDFSTQRYEIFRPGEKRIDMYNRNRLLWFYEGANGLKTGYTQKAGYCLSATALRDGFQLIAVVLGLPDTNARFAEAAILLDYGFHHFDTVTLLEKNTIAKNVEVRQGTKTHVDLTFADGFSILMKTSKADEVVIEVYTYDSFTAPLRKGSVAGYAKIVLDDEVLHTVNLEVAEDVPKLNFLQLLIEIIRNWFN